MIEIEFKDDEIGAGLARLDAALSDMTPVMRDLGDYFVESTKDRFPAGTAPDGSPWAPKSETTKAAYRRRKDSVDDRPLFGPSSALFSTIFYQADASSVRWGSPTPYAGTMQFGAEQGAFGRTARGAPVPWGNIPARPFLGVSADDQTAVLEEIADWLEDAISQA